MHLRGADDVCIVVYTHVCMYMRRTFSRIVARSFSFRKIKLYRDSRTNFIPENVWNYSAPTKLIDKHEESYEYSN